MRSANLESRYDVIVLPDMSSRQLVQGYGPGIVPGQYAGGWARMGWNTYASLCATAGH